LFYGHKGTVSTDLCAHSRTFANCMITALQGVTLCKHTVLNTSVSPSCAPFSWRAGAGTFSFRGTVPFFGCASFSWRGAPPSGRFSDLPFQCSNDSSFALGAQCMHVGLQNAQFFPVSLFPSKGLGL
jgi:hypothetical protein